MRTINDLSSAVQLLKQLYPELKLVKLTANECVCLSTNCNDFVRTKLGRYLVVLVEPFSSSYVQITIAKRI